MELPGDAVLFKRGPFSNFARAPITIRCPYTQQPRTYDTVEHFFQACKARSLEDHLRIASSEHPKAAKLAGRRVALRDDWEETKYAVMLTALRAKFSTDPLRGKLLATGDRVIAED